MLKEVVRRGTLIAFIVVMVMSTDGWAQTPRDSSESAVTDSVIYHIEGIVAQAKRASATAGGASLLEVVPDSLNIGSSVTLEDVLRALPLIRVRKNSRGETEPTLRGVESRHVAILMDGVPISLGWDLRTDLSVIPVSGVAYLTLNRGLPSVIHGPNVLGGVVEVGLGRPQDSEYLDLGRSFQLAAEVASNMGTATTFASVHDMETGDGRMSLRFGGGYKDDPGYTAPRGVPSTSKGLRDNTDVQQYNAFLSARYQSPGGAWVSLSSSGYTGRRGVQAELDATAPRFWRYPKHNRVLTAFSAGTNEYQNQWGRGTIEGSIGFDLGHNIINDYGTDGSYQNVADTEVGDDRTVSYRVMNSQSIGRRGEWRTAAMLVDILRRESIDEGHHDYYQQRLWSIGTETSWRLSTDPGRSWLRGTRVSAGVVYDGGETPQSGDKPPLGKLSSIGGRFGVSAVAPSGHVAFHGGISRRARFPSLRELYSGALGKFQSNPSLRPEHLSSSEVGLTLSLGAVEAQMVAFSQRLKGVIVKRNVEGGRQRRENMGVLRSAGVEILTSWDIRDSQLTADLTWQHVRVVDPAVQGHFYAEYQPDIAAQAEWSTPLAFDLQGTISTRYVGRQWCVTPDKDTPVQLPTSIRVDTRLSRRWGRVKTTVSTDNVGNTAIFDKCGLVQTGRLLRFQIHIS